MASGALPQMSKSDELVLVEGTLVYQHSDAWRVELIRPGQRSASTVWLPKSKCERVDDREWMVPEWLAIKEELI